MIVGRTESGIPYAELPGKWRRRVRLYAHLTLNLRPLSWKNRLEAVQKFKKGGGTVAGIKHDDAARDWMVAAEVQLRKQWGSRRPLRPPQGCWFNAAIITYLAKGQSLDASNLYQGPEDAMQNAGVIVNDYDIRWHDGSDRLRDPAWPRIEIFLTECLR